MYFLLNMGIFHCYVSVPEGNYFFEGERTDFVLKILSNLQLFSSLGKKNNLKKSEYQEVQGGPQPVVTGVKSPL